MAYKIDYIDEIEIRLREIQKRLREIQKRLNGLKKEKERKKYTGGERIY